ncbi:MAG: hypothetical protein A3I05_00370 [Deltaproteobacteria bacterium RIFCSPLOWO2_02_FULL_44_10]|nr:MAG: hypothetical protein A3C46_01235 [Deltaproteobacteria bacterium RIFCSPHIGHO2_02_FULL_44_16]OGQ47260.1 MAG: hypothetical protein A3I05_00370 [Deltaproteobacteria bacterium RIFCSPLOWO2_02_FULL_44_10]
MARITTEMRTAELPDGAEIRETCRDLGVPFGCESGLCGTCEIEVIEGYENLGPLNEREDQMGVEGNMRLACQCKIKSGEIKIRF